MCSELRISGELSQNSQPIIELMVARYQGRVFNYIQRLVGDTELSADILQDTFLAIYVSLFIHKKLESQYDVAGFLQKVQPLIYTIARNKAVDELRRRKLIRMVPFKPLSGNLNKKSNWQEEIDPAIEHKFAGAKDGLETQVILSEELKMAIEKIGRQKLSSLFLHLNGYSYKEIGQLTGESMASVKSKIFRCKQSLRQVLTNNE